MTEELQFVIATTDTDENPETLYWSNDQGFGDLTDATVFRACERETLNLPVAECDWVALPSRETHICNAPFVTRDQYEKLVAVIDRVKLDERTEDTDIYVSGILMALSLRLAPKGSDPSEPA